MTPQREIKPLDSKRIAEFEDAIEKAFDRNGEGWEYQAVSGSRVDLTKLQPNQKVCYGGKGFYILMTAK